MAKAALVTEFLAALNHPRNTEIRDLRTTILRADPGKWNAPSFRWKGDNRLTMRLQSGNRLQLVLRRGAKIKDARDFEFKEPSDLIEWLAKDRGVIRIAEQTRFGADQLRNREACAQGRCAQRADADYSSTAQMGGVRTSWRPDK